MKRISGSKYLNSNKDILIYEGSEDAKEGWIRIWFTNTTSGRTEWMPEHFWDKLTTKVEE